MVTPRRALAVISGAALGLAACSDSTAPRGSLSNDEVNELARQMGVSLAGAFAPSAIAASKRPANGISASQSAVPEDFSFEIRVTVPCPVEGTTRLTAEMTGQVDDATESLDATIHGTNAPNNCGFDVHGKTIWVTGSLTTDATVHVVNGLPQGEQSASLKGSFTWRTSDNRNGSCEVDYSAVANYTSATTGRARVTGRFCDASISFEGPITD
jgi:hypothetical protein